MSTKEWMITGLVAVTVAVMTGACIAPPTVWAEGEYKATVPALPSTALEVPEFNAQVTATATPAPGKPVQVTLSATAPAGSDTLQIPVTVTIESTTMSMMSRMMPMPTPVAQARTTVTVDSDGKGTAVVDFPLIWSEPPAPAAASTTPQKINFLERVTTYSMVLSSGTRSAGNLDVLQSLGFVLTSDISQMKIDPSANPI
jgi:hypothetical protein